MQTIAQSLPAFTPADRAHIALVRVGLRTVDDLPQPLLDKLYEHFLPQMDYGTAKGRTGDPYEFIGKKLQEGALQ